MSSPNRIRVLPEQVINQIAAGEVIERPAAAVKELLENSLDAGATQVEVEFSGGGKTYIRIEDNGSGMTPDEALLALERHATSKLRRTDDLLTLRTLGFRGEALPSIASISRFTLKTRTRDSDHGTELLVDGGKLIHRRECALGHGTRIEIAHLFSSVPARRKFLKSDATEAAHIVQLVRLHALARPDVGFHLIENGRTSFRSAPCPTMRDRVAEIWGSALARDLVEIPATAGGGQQGLRLRGLVGKAGEGRATRRDMVWLLNSRPIENRLLDNALIEAYQGFLPKGRYPLGFLFLEIDPAAVDVNIHPSKKQVRFGSEAQVRHFVWKTVADLLQGGVFDTLGTRRSGAGDARGGIAGGNGSLGGSTPVAQGGSGSQAGDTSIIEGRTDSGAGHKGAAPSDVLRSDTSASAELREGFHGLSSGIARRSLTGEALAGGGGKPLQSLPRPQIAPTAAKRPEGSPGEEGAKLDETPARDVKRDEAPAASGDGTQAATAREASALPAQEGAIDSGTSAATDGSGRKAPVANAADATGDAVSSRKVVDKENVTEFNVATGGGIAGRTIAGLREEACRTDEPCWQFLARLHKEYALMQTPAGLVVLRLRAAHERVWFERIRCYFKDENRTSQQLLLPLSIEFDPLAAAAMQEHLGFFNAHGFEVEAFGRNFYRIHAHPGWLAQERVESFVRECVEHARRGDLKAKGQRLAHEGLAKLAATRAVRLGDQLSAAEIEALAAALLRCDDPLTCPSGKPTLIEWSLSELGRRFGIKG